MKLSLKQCVTLIRACAVTAVLTMLSCFLFSFTVKVYGDEFLKQLGISKNTADSKLNSGFLLGAFDEYGISKAKNIATANRAGIVKDAVAYAKKYVTSEVFIRQYNEMRMQAKPVLTAMKSPEQLQEEMIVAAKKSVAETEGSLKKADASLKPVFEKVLAEAKKQLAEAENPNSKMLANYRRNYEPSLKMNEQNNKRLLAAWEAAYPVNHLAFVKKRLQQFLEETDDIDFNAALTEKNGVKYFVNSVYEGRGNRWKMAFRAGKEAVETARAQAAQWVLEIQ